MAKLIDRAAVPSAAGEDTRAPATDALSVPTVRRPRRVSWWGMLALVAGLALIVLYVRTRDGFVGDWSFLTVGAGAAAVAWFGAWRRGFSAATTLIALGLTSSALGDSISQIDAWRDEYPNVSLADVGWLASYVFIGGALLGILRRGRRRLDIDGWIDVAVVIVVTMMLQWELALDEMVDDATVPAFARFVWTLYPALDSVLLALVLRALVARGIGGARAYALLGGIGCWLAADFVYTLSTSAADYSVLLDVGWLLGAVLLASAACSGRPAATGPDARDEARTRERVGYGRIVVALAPLAIPGTIQVVGFVQGRDPNPIGLHVATLALLALAFARSTRLLGAEAAARAELRSQQRYATAVAANSVDALAVVDRDGVIRSDAWQLASLVGCPDDSTRGHDLFDLVSPVDVDDAREFLARALGAPGQTFETELCVEHRQGRMLWLGARIVNLLDDPDVGGVVVNLRDITDRKAAEEELAHQAFHDTLTGLANRALFADRIEHARLRSARSGIEPAVIFLDLDGFKTINDSLGHGAGDHVLQEVSSRISSAVRAVDTVARLGGDEFAVLIEQSHRPVDEAEAVAERILRALDTPVPLGEQMIKVSASVGIAIGDERATAASMLRDADVAMYRAKTTGKSRWVVYDPEMRTAAVERLQLETDLLGALEAGQFRLVYQPVIELESERVVGFEALLRWNHPTLGTIAPDKFIPIAEDTGMIVPIGAWVLTEACATAARWHHEHPDRRELSMAVNVSARQIASPELLVHVTDALDRSGLDRHCLVLEMTETTLVQDAATAAQRLTELRELGVRLAIDDFGTGYSSLSYLRQFPVDILKIDRSFIDAITDRDQVPAIVRGLLDLGRTLQLETVAEGVELDLQRDRLRDEHCEYAQGYLFARPLEIGDADELLARLDRSMAPAVKPA